MKHSGQTKRTSVVRTKKPIVGPAALSNEVVPASSTPPREPMLVEQAPENPKRVILEAAAQERFMRVAQTKNLKIAEHLMTPLTRIIGRFSTAGTVAESLMIGCDMLENLAPQGAAQNMLAQQMVCTHFAAMASLVTAGAEGNTIEQVDIYANRAMRLMRLSVAQQELWARLTGKTGAQKVIVEHVHVGEGGQAVVGHVNVAPRGEGEGVTIKNEGQPHEGTK